MTSFLPTSSPSFVSSRLGHPRRHWNWARTSRTIRKDCAKIPGSLQINLLFTIYAEQASAKADANLYFFRRHCHQNPQARHHRFGGAERDRTADPLLAKQVLSQLSYSPDSYNPLTAFCMVGLGRIELPTSRLSGVRSNHLSYRPYGLSY